jgi:hypothetical protein
MFMWAVNKKNVFQIGQGCRILKSAANSYVLFILLCEQGILHNSKLKKYAISIIASRFELRSYLHFRLILKVALVQMLAQNMMQRGIHQFLYLWF